MLWISHRGNLNGPTPERENHPDYIEEALTLGFDVEVDVWGKDGHLYLGHDEPVMLLPDSLISSNRIWYHCKNVEAVIIFQLRGSAPWKVKYFCHQEDDHTLTSNNRIWTYPGAKLVPGAIAVLPEQGPGGGDWRKCHAVCTDYIYLYKDAYDKGSDIN